MDEYLKGIFHGFLIIPVCLILTFGLIFVVDMAVSNRLSFTYNSNVCKANDGILVNNKYCSLVVDGGVCIVSIEDIVRKSELGYYDCEVY